MVCLNSRLRLHHSIGQVASQVWVSCIPCPFQYNFSLDKVAYMGLLGYVLSPSWLLVQVREWYTLRAVLLDEMSFWFQCWLMTSGSVHSCSLLVRRAFTSELPYKSVWILCSWNTRSLKPHSLNRCILAWYLRLQGLYCFSLIIFYGHQHWYNIHNAYIFTYKKLIWIFKS